MKKELLFEIQCHYFYHWKIDNRKDSFDFANNSNTHNRLGHYFDENYIQLTSS